MENNLSFNNKRIIEYEKYLLGSYIQGAPIGDGVTESVFSTAVHKTIFSVVKELKAKSLGLNILILVSELEKRGKLEAAGGAAYIAELTSAASTVNTFFYEGEILTAYRGRSLCNAAVLARESLEKGESPDVVNERLASTLETLSRITKADKGISFKDLLTKQFPPENWLIDGLITTGLTVLTGTSKIGKSWAALQLVTALDQGGYFLGQLKAEKCDCLYLALEDTEKRIQKRLKKQGITSFNGSRLEVKRRTVGELRNFLKENPQYQVIVIDTFQKMMGLDDLNDYAKTVNGMSALKAIADDLNRAVIVIHHNRKSSENDTDFMESALGSTGINATADCTLTMKRKRGVETATLNATGRDIEDKTFTLAWDKEICSWSITDQTELAPSVPEAQREILDLLESEDRHWTTGEIAEKLGKNKPAISNLLKRLQETGLIESPYYGQYRVKNSFMVSHPLRERETVKAGETGKTIEIPSKSDNVFIFPEQIIKTDPAAGQEMEIW